jgi:hypothetical protein
MNYQETINKIKQLFEMAAPMNPDMAQMTDYILQDGTKISCDKLAIGGTVTLNGAPAPDGDHQLQDGTIIQTAAGIITEISSPAEEAQDQEVNSDLAMVPQPAATPEVTLAPVHEKMAKMEADMAAITTKCQKLEETMANHAEGMKKMIGMVEQMAKAPIADPAAKVSNQYTNEKAIAKDERFSAIVEAMKNIKN